jgi:thiosulfate/3-mercaptopyruvate sulfurtransferase
MSFVNPQYLVETDWLADHLDDPDLRIVDCTQYLPTYGEKVEITTVSGRENYAKGHIPGAAYVDLLGELTDRNQQGMYAPMPPAEQFAAVMSRRVWATARGPCSTMASSVCMRRASGGCCEPSDLTTPPC